MTISVSGPFNHAPIATDHGSMDRRRALTDGAKAAISGSYVIFSAGNLPRTGLPYWLTKFIVEGHSMVSLGNTGFPFSDSKSEGEATY